MLSLLLDRRYASFSLFLVIGLCIASVKGEESVCHQWDVCSQICKESENGRNYTCDCLEEFHVGEDQRSCISDDPNLRIVFAIENSVRISYINSSRSILEKVFQTTEQTVGVTVDVKGGFVYWTAATEGKEAVHRTRADSNGPIEPIVDTGLRLPEGIAFDWVTGNIYIVDSNRSQIFVCLGNGKMCDVLVTQSTVEKPRGIALHPTLGIMFWTNWGEKSSIMGASMDGTSVVPIVSEEIKWPNSLAVDHGRNRIFWTDAFHDKIETASLTGSDRQLVNMDNVNHPFSLEVFGDLIFWSDWELKRIQSCTKFACKADIHTVLEGFVNGIAVFHPAAQPLTRSNSCQSRCSHICVLSGKSSYSCKCPVGLKLDRSRKVCIEDESTPSMLIGHDDYIKVVRLGSIGRSIDLVNKTRVAGLSRIGAVVYNPVNDTVFVSDLTWKTIFEYKFSSGVLKPISSRNLDSVKSMSLDPIGENLYWVDSGRRKVEVMSCRTMSKGIIAYEAADYPQSIVVVPEERCLFVGSIGRILKMNMNGYNRRTLVRISRGRGEPISLTYNAELKHIFWIDTIDDSIAHIDINGRVLAKLKGTVAPYSITSFGSRIFWTDSGTQLMHTLAVLDWSQESPIFVEQVDDKYVADMANFYATLNIMQKGMTVYEDLRRDHDCSPSRTKIKIRKCSHICLLSAERDVGTCACPEGMELDRAGTNCSLTKSYCLKSQFRCDDQGCIDAERQCDGRVDCEGGEDELNCTPSCPVDTFQCKDSACISLASVCDNEKDCVDDGGSDELDCCVTPPNGTDCLCNPGFEPHARNLRLCVDIDECTSANPCEHDCVNTLGSFKCLCHQGYMLGSDQRHCKYTNTLNKNSTPAVESVPSGNGNGQQARFPIGWAILVVFIMCLALGGAAFLFYRKRFQSHVYRRSFPIVPR